MVVNHTSPRSPAPSASERQASLEIRLRVAANVKRLRRERGLTQQALPAAFGRSKNSVSWIERGKLNVTLSTLAHFAHGLQCCESALLEHVPQDALPLRPPDARACASDPKRSATSDLRDRLAKNLRYLRGSRRMTQRRLGRHSGLGAWVIGSVTSNTAGAT